MLNVLVSTIRFNIARLSSGIDRPPRTRNISPLWVVLNLKLTDYIFCLRSIYLTNKIRKKAGSPLFVKNRQELFSKNVAVENRFSDRAGNHPEKGRVIPVQRVLQLYRYFQSFRHGF
jgi:hypothetical protein